VTVGVFAAATGRLIVWPGRDAPEKADAIVMFGGTPGRLGHAVSLARQGYAPVLVVSTPVPGEGCPPRIPGVETICFRPDPLTTRGESRETGRLAAERGWKKIIVVTAVTQTTRARLRLRRCYPGQVLMSPVTVPPWSWGYWIAYEWGAMVKALVWQRSC
jgi:uncharacterized SAM-binding protein YcdF (DUF218 family)